MYSLDINFLKDRSEQKAAKRSHKKSPTYVGSLTPIYLGLAGGLVLPVFVVAGWFFLQNQNAQLETKVATIDAELSRIKVQQENLKKIQAETGQIQSETKALATVFNQIRPWSAMLQDLRDRIPKTVQIESVEQISASATTPAAKPAAKPAATSSSKNSKATDKQPTQSVATPIQVGAIQIVGIARSFNDVNDFLLTLKQSAFLQSGETKIVTAELIDNPIQVPTSPDKNVKIVLPQVVKYTIQSNLSDVPASDILRELERKGTFGLVTRIRTLQQRGVIQQ
jgi:type IV pilus assembly protein PilN